MHRNLFSKEVDNSEPIPQQAGQEEARQDGKEETEEDEGKEGKSETLPKDNQAAPKNANVNAIDGHDSSNIEKPQVKAQEKRKLREEAIQSARERYLARKKAKGNDKWFV